MERYSERGPIVHFKKLKKLRVCISKAKSVEVSQPSKLAKTNHGTDTSKHVVRRLNTSKVLWEVCRDHEVNIKRC